MKYILVMILFFSSLYANRDGGPYLGVGYGVSEYDSDKIYETLKEDTSRAMTIYGGAYINKHFSVELGYVDFTSFSSKNGYIVDDIKILEFSLFSVSTLAHYPIWDDRLDFYAKFGAGQIDYDSGSGFTFVFGIGTAVRFNDYMSLKLAYEKYPFGYDSTSNGSADNEMSIDYVYSVIEVQF